MPIIVNKISRNKLLKFKNLMKLSIGVIVLLFSINILYQMKPNAASAMAGTIFDRGSRTRYFSGTSGIEFHNVLPAIYNFRRNREESGVQYAVNMNILLGISDSELWNQWKDSKNVKKYGTVKDLAGAIETFEEYSRTTANIGKPQNFTEYSQFMEANKDNPLRLYSVGPINQCIQTIHNKDTSTAPTNPKIITSASEYNTKREKCIKWFDTGFRFLKYSLAGVKQSNKGAFNEAYSAVKADNQTEVTIQKMGFGGELYNQYTKKKCHVY